MRHDGWSCSVGGQRRRRPDRHASTCIQSGLTARTSVPKVHVASIWPECRCRAGEIPAGTSRAGPAGSRPESPESPRLTRRRTPSSEA